MMLILCINGTENNIGKQRETCDLISKLGFKEMKEYTTRRPRNEDEANRYILVTENQFEELVNKDIIISKRETEHGTAKYGTPRFYGASKYVEIVNSYTLKAVKDMYKKQVIEVVLKEGNDIGIEVIKHEGSTVINVSDALPTIVIATEILKITRREKNERM